MIYSYDGQFSCMCPRTGAQRAMDYGGFERDRNTLKYRCPPRYSGVTCEGREQCPVADAVHIKLAEDRRVFSPVARSSYEGIRRRGPPASVLEQGRDSDYHEARERTLPGAD